MLKDWKISARAAYIACLIVTFLLFLAWRDVPMGQSGTPWVHIIYALISAIAAFMVSLVFIRTFQRKNHGVFFFLFMAFFSLALFWTLHGFSTMNGLNGSPIIFEISILVANLLSSIFFVLALLKLIQAPKLKKKFVNHCFFGFIFLECMLAFFLTMYAPSLSTLDPIIARVLNFAVIIIYVVAGLVFIRVSNEFTTIRLEVVGATSWVLALGLVFRNSVELWTFGWWLYHFVTTAAIIGTYLILRNDEKAQKISRSVDEVLKDKS